MINCFMVPMATNLAPPHFGIPTLILGVALFGPPTFGLLPSPLVIFCEWSILPADSNFHVNRRVVLHATNLRHGTDGFTSPPKEGMLWIFSPEKSDGFGRVRTRDLGVPEASMLTTRPPKPLGGGIILRWIFRKWDVRVWTGWSGLG